MRNEQPVPTEGGWRCCRCIGRSCRCTCNPSTPIQARHSQFLTNATANDSTGWEDSFYFASSLSYVRGGAGIRGFGGKLSFRDDSHHCASSDAHSLFCSHPVNSWMVNMAFALVVVDLAFCYIKFKLISLLLRSPFRDKVARVGPFGGFRGLDRTR